MFSKKEETAAASRPATTYARRCSLFNDDPPWVRSSYHVSHHIASVYVYIDIDMCQLKTFRIQKRKQRKGHVRTRWQLDR